MFAQEYWLVFVLNTQQYTPIDLDVPIGSMYGTFSGFVW